MPLGDFAGVSNAAELAAVAAAFGFPLMVKSRKLAYDGKGNAAGPGIYCSPRHRMPCNTKTTVQNALDFAQGQFLAHIARHVIGCCATRNRGLDMRRMT